MEIHLRKFSVSPIRPGIIAMAIVLLAGCASPSPEEQGPTRTELDTMGKKAVATLLEKKPEARETFDRSVGYAVLDMTITKIPVVGTGSGFGIVIDKRTNSRTYIRISQFEVGGGMGAEKYKVIIIFDDAKLVEKVATGTWHYEAGAEAASGSESTTSDTVKSDKGYKAYKLSESGLLVRVTVRIAYAEPYPVD